MKKGKIFALGLIVCLMAGGMLLFGCNLILCPGGGTSGGAYECDTSWLYGNTYNYWQCTNRCLTNGSGTTLYDMSCDC